MSLRRCMRRLRDASIPAGVAQTIKKKQPVSHRRSAVCCVLSPRFMVYKYDLHVGVLFFNGNFHT